MVVASWPVLLAWLARELDEGCTPLRLARLPIGLCCQAVLPYHRLAPSWALHGMVVANWPVLLAWLARELDEGCTPLRLARLPIGREVGGA
eukprot:1160743-Pelagomonas_calceolata.AAC.2